MRFLSWSEVDLLATNTIEPYGGAGSFAGLALVLRSCGLVVLLSVLGSFPFRLLLGVALLDGRRRDSRGEPPGATEVASSRGP